MPPIIAATCWPSSNSRPGAAATTPVASMPSTRGKVTPCARPSRVCSSERLIPKALTRMSTQPGRGSGTGTSRIRSASGGPGGSSTTARMVAVMSVPSGLCLHAFPCGRGPLDGGDELVAPDGVGEVRHGAGPVVDVCRQRGVDPSDVVGGRSFQAGERGPLLCQCRRGGKLGGLVAPVCSGDGQRIDLGLGGVGGDPERSVGSVDLPQEPGTAGHCLTEVEAGGRSGREGADHRDLVGRRFDDLL